MDESVSLGLDGEDRGHTTPGLLAKLVSDLDWSRTPLGARANWPQSLRTAAGIVLNSPVPMVLLWGEDGVMIYNDAYSVFAGRRHPELLGSNVREGWPEVAGFNDNVMKVVLAGRTLAYRDQELTLLRSGAPEQVWMDLDYSPVPDESGRPAGVIAIVIETTARVLAERARQAAEARATQVIEGMREGFILLDREFRILAMNAEGERVEKRPREALIGRTHWEAWPGSEEDELGRHYKRAMAERVPVSFDHRYVWPDGRAAWIEMRAYPSGDGLAIFYRDVTARKEAEARLRESEDHYRHAVELDPQTAWTAAPDGQLDHVGSRWMEWTGTTGLDSTWADGLHPDDRARTFEVWGRSVATAEPYDIEHRVKMRDGSFRWMHSRAYPRRDEAGRIVKWYGTTEDVHDRWVAEEERAEQARTLEILNRTGALIAAEIDLERVVQVVTEAGVELTGAGFGAFFYNLLNEAGESYMLYSIAGVDPSHFDRFPMPRATAIFQPTFKGEGVIRSDDILLDPRYGKSDPHRGMPEGHLPVRSYLAVPVASRSGEVIGGLFFGHADPGVFSQRHEGIILGIAGQAAIAIDNARLFDSARKEIEARRAAEEALAVSEAKFRAIVDHVDQMIWSTLPDGTPDFYNQRWHDYTGAPAGSTDGEGWSELVHPDDRDRARGLWRRAVEAGEPYHIEYRLRHRSGEYRWVLGRAQPVRDSGGQIDRWYGTCTDIEDIVQARQVLARSREQLEQLVSERTRELEQAQDALRQAQKMEAVGQLTGGIAHDFNNMLAVVVGSLDLLGRRLGGADEPVRRYVDAAADGARRAALLTQRLLAFSRQQPLRPEPIQANGLVAGMADLVRRSLGTSIHLETVLAGGLWRTHADPNQLENVILNLAVNARDAMPDGGRLTVETQNAHLDRRYAVAHPGVAEGQYVLLAVTDTGSGMQPDIVARAFDPFFTTKEVGKGTGLGLSQVYGFVKQSGGHVKIYSEPGLGTTVKVYLPRYVAEPGELVEAAETIPVATGDRQELVLVVEDEPAVRRFSVDALEELNYRVLEADGAQSALRLLDSHPEIALLFTDVVMPEVNGRKLADEARRRRPDLKVLFTTGYTRNAVVHNGVLDAGVELIGKPFTLEELAGKVRQVLDAP